MHIEQWWYSLPSRLRSWVHPGQVDREMKEEIREHLEQQIRENIGKGMSAEEARYSAMRMLGGMAQIEQQCRDTRGGSIAEALWKTSFGTYVTGSGNCGAAPDFLLWQLGASHLALARTLPC